MECFEKKIPALTGGEDYCLWNVQARLTDSSSLVNDTDCNIKVQTYVPRLYAFDYNRVGIDIDTEWEAKNEI